MEIWERVNGSLLHGEQLIQLLPEVAVLIMTGLCAAREEVLQPFVPLLGVVLLLIAEEVQALSAHLRCLCRVERKIILMKTVLTVRVDGPVSHREAEAVYAQAVAIVVEEVHHVAVEVVHVVHADNT